MHHSTETIKNQSLLIHRCGLSGLPDTLTYGYIMPKIRINYKYMKLLLVDDQAEILSYLKKSFEEACFVVDTASDGEQGSYLARTNHYDLIILDNSMPLKNGEEVVREIRADGIGTAIIMLSVRSETSAKIGLLNLGVDDYVTKPFSFEELHARVNALLRRPNIIKQKILTTDDLILDTSKQIVTRGDKEIYLTKKEFMFLEYLLQNRGSVLSRSMILEHVWDMNADPFSNTIESHILSLRKKIDSNRENKLIVTIPGRGYKIRD